MKIPSSKDHQSAGDQSTMTPMIDVVFLLLIFFVCAAAGQIRESSLSTDLTSGSIETTTPETTPEEQPDPVWLYLKRTPAENKTTVRVNQGGVEYEDLNLLRENLMALGDLAREEIPIILDIEKQVPAKDLIAVYDACREADFQTIKFATNRNTDNK